MDFIDFMVTIFQSKTKTIVSSAKSYEDNTQFKVHTATKFGNPDQKLQPRQTYEKIYY